MTAYICHISTLTLTLTTYLWGHTAYQNWVIKEPANSKQQDSKSTIL